ncbi:hypothetical protein [Streptomyces regalis]|uniref:Uncharacterized protein n=1 Tax=Streptomyces regalis TaxID=68262 RepID=A0A101J8I1_9ACTN|nr:hypothetical protein [Streptomyces regalis]KUL22213.1 hypothetical protein ADL12_43110 [Streptomyces regalis]
MQRSLPSIASVARTTRRFAPPSAPSPPPRACSAPPATRSARPFAPAAPVVEQAQQAPVTAPDPADVYSDEEMPSVETIEAAAKEYDRAADQARRADRGKRAARKVLDRLPVGICGAWVVERVTSSRETADLDAIRTTYKRLGLGRVPMKRCAPSVKVHRAKPVPAVEQIQVAEAVAA